MYGHCTLTNTVVFKCKLIFGFAQIVKQRCSFDVTPCFCTGITRRDDQIISGFWSLTKIKILNEFEQCPAAIKVHHVVKLLVKGFTFI